MTTATVVASSAGHRIAKLALRIVVLCVIWEVGVRFFEPPDYLLPRLSAVIDVMVVQHKTLAVHSWTTIWETLVGFGIAVVGGIVGAIALSLSPRLAMVLWPTIMFAQITPKIALAPLLLAWFGFGLLPKMIVAFMMTFFPILLHTFAGFRSIEAEKEELARSMHASRVSYFLRFQFPHALPHIFSGARVAITLALIGAIVAEFVG
jgi:NitT/TauT family transport system permease protein